jgi:hypothetical protein
VFVPNTLPIDLSSQPQRIEPVAPRNYNAPWRGELVLACTKCQKKLRKHKGSKSLASLKKWFKKRGKSDRDAPEVKIIGIGCVKMCPKGGVTIARQHQLCEAGGEVSILRSEAELDGLYALIADQQTRGKLPKSA